MPSLTDLPLDLLVDSFFPLLPLSTIVALDATSKYLHAAANDPVLWSRLLRRDFRFPVASTARVTGFKLLYSRLAKPRVYVWGQDSNGRLGLPPSETSKYKRGLGVPTPVQLETTDDGRPIVGWIDIKASGYGFHALDWEGKVWVWGTLDGSRWADSSVSYAHPGKCVSRPVPLPVQDLPPLQCLCASRTSGLGLDDAGFVYEWRSWGRVLRLKQTPWLPQKVRQISCGWEVNALLDHQGQVWIWKSLRLYDSSLPETPPQSEEAPQRKVEDVDVSGEVIMCPVVPIQNGERECIIKIAAGSNFLIALTRLGTVLKLDLSEPDQMTAGRVDQSTRYFQDRLYPEFLSGHRTWHSLELFWNIEKVRELDVFQRDGTLKPKDDFKVTHISAEFNNFAVYQVTQHAEDSIVLIGNAESDEPKVYPELQGRGVIDVCLGDYHKGALLESGQLLTWGQYSNGALGLEAPGAMRHNFLPTFRPRARFGFAFGGRPIPARPPVDIAEVTTPTPIPRFSGEQVSYSNPGTSKSKSRSKEKQSEDDDSDGEFVYSASFAGWHSGCLAVSVRRPCNAQEHV